MANRIDADRTTVKVALLQQTSTFKESQNAWKVCRNIFFCKDEAGKPLCQLLMVGLASAKSCCVILNECTMNFICRRQELCLSAYSLVSLNQLVSYIHSCLFSFRT